MQIISVFLCSVGLIQYLSPFSNAQVETGTHSDCRDKKKVTTVSDCLL